MRTFIRNYVQGCTHCQEFKANWSPSKSTLVPIKGPTTTWCFANCTIDLIRGLLLSNRYNCILSMVDHRLTKGVILILITKIADYCKIAKLLHNNLYKQFGLHDSMISDRDPQFMARLAQEYNKLIKVNPKFSTAFYPQTDGTMERFNQEVEVYLSIFCQNNPNTWSSKLSTAEFIYNNQRHSERKHTLCKLMFGYTPKALSTAFEWTNAPKVEERLKGLEQDWQEAPTAHKFARQKMIKWSEHAYEPLKEGQQVLLDTRNLKILYPARKFRPRQEGPFTIKEVLGKVTYCLNLLLKWKNMHNIFYTKLLSPYTETKAHGPNFKRPPPDIIDGEEEHEVEAIVNHRTVGPWTRRRREYLVCWKGYPDSENMWQSLSLLKNTRTPVRGYLI